MFTTKKRLRLPRIAVILLTIWTIFGTLVSFRIHGSSSMILSQWYEPTLDILYVLKPLREVKNKLLGWSTEDTRLDRFLLLTPRIQRTDELTQSTPWYLFAAINKQSSLSNILHQIKNREINFLQATQNSALHIRNLGMLLLDVERGFVWHWWFDLFCTFTGLYLVFVILFRQRHRLALFGATWIAFSAGNYGWFDQIYVFLGYPLMAIAGLFFQMTSHSRKSQILIIPIIVYAIYESLTIPYPAWQIPWGYVCAAITAIIIWQYKLWKIIYIDQFTLLIAVITIVMTLLIVGLYYWASWPSLQTLANVSYPVARRNNGGELQFGVLFDGLGSIITAYEEDPSSTTLFGYYNFLPALLTVFVFVPKRIRKLDGLAIVAWGLLGLCCFYMFIGFPHWLGAITLWDRSTSTRMVNITGIVMIIICLSWLYNLSDKKISPPGSRLSFFSACILGASNIFFSIILKSGATDAASLLSLRLFMSVLVALLGFWFIRGHQKLFCFGVLVLTLATSMFYHPLSFGLSPIFESNLGKKLYALNHQSDPPPRWISYSDPTYAPALIKATGGEVLNGYGGYLGATPKMSEWRNFDLNQNQVDIYNRFAQVSFVYTTDISKVDLRLIYYAGVEITIHPRNKILKNLGVKYVLALFGEYDQFMQIGLIPIYTSPNNYATIFEIPQ